MTAYVTVQLKPSPVGSGVRAEMEFSIDVSEERCIKEAGKPSRELNVTDSFIQSLFRDALVRKLTEVEELHTGEQQTTA